MVPPGSSSVIDTDCPPGVRRALEGPAMRDAGGGLTLARRASARQASAGRWTAAGDHAPKVERSIANQQHVHHHHQAAPSIPPSQPAPGHCRCQGTSDSRSIRRCLSASSSRASSLSAGRTLTVCSVVAMWPDLWRVLDLGADRCSGLGRRRRPHQHAPCRPVQPGEDVDQARRARQVGVGVVQVGHNHLDRSAERAVLPACLDQDLNASCEL